jgi:hypothetical protein
MVRSSLFIDGLRICAAERRALAFGSRAFFPFPPVKTSLFPSPARESEVVEEGSDELRDK